MLEYIPESTEKLEYLPERSELNKLQYKKFRMAC